MADLKNLRDLLHHEVQIMYSGENLIVAGLTRMIAKTHSNELKMAFQKHLTETQLQAKRLEDVAELLDIDIDDEAENPGIAGLIAEGELVMHKDATPETLDATLIAGAQKIEHYEIAGYGTAVYIAQQLGLTSVANILNGILDEEKKTNEILNNLAKNIINVRAE
jgi:ferritin-like metal-binding protein YciE